MSDTPIADYIFNFPSNEMAPWAIHNKVSKLERELQEAKKQLGYVLMFAPRIDDNFEITCDNIKQFLNKVKK